MDNAEFKNEILKIASDIQELIDDVETAQHEKQAQENNHGNYEKTASHQHMSMGDVGSKPDASANPLMDFILS